MPVGSELYRSLKEFEQKAPLLKDLSGEGNIIISTNGKTIREIGMPMHYVNPGLEGIVAPQSVLAYKTGDGLFMEGSIGASFRDHKRFLAEEQSKLDTKYPGVGLIARLATASELAEISKDHFDKTGDRLFGVNYGYRSSWVSDYDEIGRQGLFGNWHIQMGAEATLVPPQLSTPYIGLVVVTEIASSF
ncbi:MAG TPA: hypothetical protein VHE53_04560 [Patescibacteria group bacterium]|nr:hypothetical protein [Patescibacteria group bacterium]